MSDIVEKLRWHREHPVTGQMVLANLDGPEAAAEIERLRAALREIAGLGVIIASDMAIIALREARAALEERT